MGLVNALSALASNISDMFRIECTFACSPAHAVNDPATATHLYRIAQEAVNNAVKHGAATRVEIALQREPEHLVLRICDNGSGIRTHPGSTTGMGMRTMRYRAAVIGGGIAVMSNPGGGTIVTCTAPVA
jgi:two-component system CheB/CheR fusion protein